MAEPDSTSNPDASAHALKCDAYPGYEWVATLSGNDWDAIGYLDRLFAQHQLDGFCPGASAFAGFLVRSEHAAEARRLISADTWLRQRQGSLEDETGSHPFHELGGKT